MAEDKTKKHLRDEKWKKTHMTMVTTRFHNINDADVLEYLEKSGNKADAIRQAIRAQIEKEKEQ